MKIVLKAACLRVEYGMQQVFSIDEAELREGDRVALVGPNGAGKTTLLRALAADPAVEASGRVTREGSLHHLPQLEEGLAEASMAETAQWGVGNIPTGDGASGGERSRRKLAAAFSANAGILLLDEPTSNLDMAGVEWLEKELGRFRGALVLVSHDRALMDAVCTQVWELEGGRLAVYPGNYSAYARQREHARESAWREYAAYRQEASRLMAAARQMEHSAASVKQVTGRMIYQDGRSPDRAKDKFAKRAKATLRRMEQMQKKERPPLEPDIRAAMEPSGPIVARTAAYVRGLTVRFGERLVLDGAEASIPTGRRTVIMGPNGAGKTTLMRALLGEEGHLAQGAKLARFDQGHEQINPDITLLENVMTASVRPEWAARAVLARLGLYARDVSKPARVLSGGERAKCLLARLLVSGANFLALDEPSNYLDLYAMGALEEMLGGFEGTLVMITHDRALADAVADQLLWVEGGAVTSFAGGYTAYKRDKEAPDADIADRAVRAELLRMRMAELSARIDRAPADNKAELEAEYLSIAKELRGYR